MSTTTTSLPLPSRSKKRKYNDDPLKKAYENVASITPRRPSTERPGTPHRFFQSSYTVCMKGDAVDESKKSSKQDPAAVSSKNNVVHVHANGLCIVCCCCNDNDELLLSDDSCIQKVEFLVPPNNNNTNTNLSAGERRKLISKMLRSGNQQQPVVQSSPHHVVIVTPETPLVKITTMNQQQQLIVCAGVWGILLEVNPHLEPSLLQTDPLLDGYLAVILPTGPFPPKHLLMSSEQETETTTVSTAPVKRTKRDET